MIEMQNNKLIDENIKNKNELIYLRTMVTSLRHMISNHKTIQYLKNIYDESDSNKRKDSLYSIQEEEEEEGNVVLLPLNSNHKQIHHKSSDILHHYKRNDDDDDSMNGNRLDYLNDIKEDSNDNEEILENNPILNIEFLMFLKRYFIYEIYDEKQTKTNQEDIMKHDDVSIDEDESWCESKRLIDFLTYYGLQSYEFELVKNFFF